MRKIVLLFYVFSFSTIFSQNKLSFDFDYATFKYDEESVFLEIYYSFNQTTLTIEDSEAGPAISANLVVQLVNEKDEKTIDELYNLFSLVDTSSSEFKDTDLVGVLSFRVPAGEYRLILIASDKYKLSNTKSISKDVNVNVFDNGLPAISDIEFSNKIIQEGADSNSIYYKNSLEIIPNPKNLYGATSPVLYYYFELYNGHTDGENNEYKLERIISKNSNSVDVQNEVIKFSADDLVKAGFVNIANLKSGKYSLDLNVKDSENKIIAQKAKDFFIYNPNLKEVKTNDPQKDYIKSEFGIYNEEECDYNFDVAKYIAAESEKDLYESLENLDAKRKFLYEFWSKRDIEPETTLNEYKEEYLARVAYVNSNYGHRHKDGYKTDRGRVALVYGIPDRVDTRNNEAEYKPYEVWNYDSIEGGVVFIFGDTMGISEMELLHSTKRGELYDSNWQRRLTIKGGY